METRALRRVSVASEVGFCFGVKRAIGVARQALDEHGQVVILGDLVHNRHVTDELEARGLRKVDDVQGHTGSTMLIRAHGLPYRKRREAEELGLNVLDATCPIVTRAQEAARGLEDRGCQVVVIGDREHAEVKGIVGALERPALIIDSLEELRQAHEDGRLRRKVGVVFQTTHALELCREVVTELVFMCKDVHIINTICRPVQKRQDDALSIARQVDLMLVVGSRTSANTVELAALCRHYNPRTLHIQDESELADEDFAWAGHVGVASGLSTPEDLVEAVIARVHDFQGPVTPNARPSETRYATPHGPSH